MCHTCSDSAGCKAASARGHMQITRVPSLLTYQLAAAASELLGACRKAAGGSTAGMKRACMHARSAHACMHAHARAGSVVQQLQRTPGDLETWHEYLQSAGGAD